MRTTYNIEEVRFAVEEYESIKALLDTNRRGLRWIPYHIDIQRAYRSLSRPQREAILLHGFYGYSQETAAKLLFISQPTLHRRYMCGLEAMVTYLNGARPE